MIRILLVEDEPEKKRLISAALMGVDGFDLNALDCCTDALSAKKLLKQRKYDLLILDINVPPTPAKKAELGGGLDVLRYIRLNMQAIKPSYIVGMTAYDDGFEAAQVEFSSPLWKLIRFSYGGLEWEEPLKSAVKFLIEQSCPPYVSDGKTFHIDVGIVVGLEEELKSIREMGVWEAVRVAHDGASYYRTTFDSSDGPLTVVAVAAPRMGMPAAAVTATKLIMTFRPKYLAVLGICAGVRGKVAIGDVIVADPIFDWGSGKWVKDPASRALKFRPAAYPWRLDEIVRSRLVAVGDDGVTLKKVYDSFAGPKPDVVPRVVAEVAASGGSVLQASELVEEVCEQHKNLVGIDMESYAVFTAAEYCSEPRPTCISIKAVCDFGDDEKNDLFHEYAAFISARFFREFVISSLIADS